MRQTLSFLSLYSLLTLNNNNNEEDARYDTVVKSTDIVDNCGNNNENTCRTTNGITTNNGTTTTTNNNEDSSGTKTVTLYLIRHGEAVHNVKEKAAKQRAKEEAVQEGHDPDSEEVLCRMEEARKAVLNDHRLFDAPLSDLGREETADAVHRIQQTIAEHHGGDGDGSSLEPPSEVLVSPLRRTLQTADILFPDHQNIRVREEVRERCTRLPPDTYDVSETLRRQKSEYQRFCTSQWKESQECKEPEHDGDDDDGVCPGACDASSGGSSCAEDDDDSNDKLISKSQSSAIQAGQEEVENKAMLRTRTEDLFRVLAESDHGSIAVVTHKGYLRELERGPFEQSDAKEFKNCEMRVYKVSINKDNDLESVSRIV